MYSVCCYRILFSVLWALSTYFPLAHMVWGGGYFGELGLLDFAGGIVVHLSAGAAALVAAIMVSLYEDPVTATGAVIQYKLMRVSFT